MIKPESIENLKSIADIVDVVGNYVQLKKQGSNYTALCPFHSEKTPSFVVSPAKQIYHCFGCQATGDVIKFIMEIEKLSYPEAIEKLASFYNFKLEYTKSSHSINRDILEKVNSFYIQELNKNKFAIEYLKKRGIYESTIEKFALGYAPESKKQFNFFKNANININDLRELGVLSENGEYPRLIERITFPIFSTTGKIIAMGGRTISNHPAKYINFTNTKIFNKSKTFYGLNFAREHILRKKEIIIVEGYMDVIMLHQAGYNTTVATLGTALTKDHLPQLSKLNAKIYLSYDGDNAGINAALKAAKLLFRAFFEGKVVLFPEGKDPADIIKNNEDPEKYFKNGTCFSEFIIKHTINKYDTKNPVQKKHALDELKEYIKTLPEILQESFVSKAAQYLQTSPRLLLIKSSPNRQLTAKNIDIAEATIIKSLYDHPEYIEKISKYLKPEMLKTYQYELNQIYSQNFQDPKLLDIVLRNEVLSMDLKSLEQQIIKVLKPYYTEKLKKLRFQNISDEEKYSEMKKINKILLNLKKGSLDEINSNV